MCQDIYREPKCINRKFGIKESRKIITARIWILLTDLINALPSNSSVNTVLHVIIDEAVFSMSSAPRQVLVTDQRTCSLTRDMCFLCGLHHANNRGAVFSVRGPCREDIRKYGNGN
jgi:hypothetical protein